jgi:hypothetical protein
MSGPEDVIPAEYVLIRAARYLGVAPWDLEERPSFWESWALVSQNAETEAENYRAKHPRSG